jgi:hypothetical protein
VLHSKPTPAHEHSPHPWLEPVPRASEPSASELESHGYTLVRSGPDVDAAEVELAGVSAVEIVVRWGSSVLCVAHLNPPRDFYVGEQLHASEPCDCVLPASVVGARRLPLLLRSGGEPLLVIPSAAAGFFRSASGEICSLEVLRERATPFLEVDGGCTVPLPIGARAWLQIGGCVFHVSGVVAGKPARRGLFTSDWTSAPYFGLSLALHAGLVGVLAFLTPSLGLADEEQLDRERLYAMQQYLDSSSERERQQNPGVRREESNTQDGGTGAPAPGSEGNMGKPMATAVNKRYAIAGPKNNPDPHLSRREMIREATEFGLIGLLQSAAEGSLAPTAPWGRDTALGDDEISARGNMWGEGLGEAIGGGALGLLGLGEGSGESGLGIGLALDGIGHGLGRSPGQGIGNSGGRLGGKYTTRPIGVRSANAIVSGRLPSEVIQRVVRQNFGRFRLCYAQGLTRNPNLEGRVAARFVISRDGAVSAVSNGGSDLPDSAVTSCVLSAFYGLSFPKPELGIVTVVYPILLSPG